MKFIRYEDWSVRARGATPASHPIGATKGVTLHWEGPGMGLFSHDKCDDKVRSIQNFHRDTKRWADIAYNAVVCPHGYVFEGRGVHTKSAANGSTLANDDWYAVCYLSGEGDPFTGEAKLAFVDAVQWLRREGAAGSLVNGHRDHKATACPGNEIYAWLQKANFEFTPPPPTQTLAPVPKVARPTPLKVATFNIRSYPLMRPYQVKADLGRVKGWAHWYCFQELSPLWYRDLLKEAFPLPGFQMRRLATGECMAWDNERFQWGWAGKTKLNDIIPLVCGPRYANWMWVWDRKAGCRLSFGDVHLPPKKDSNKRAARAHADGLAKLKGSIWAQLMKAPGRHIIIGGDWNCSSATIYRALGREIAGRKVTVINQPREDGRPAIDHIVLIGDFKIGHRGAIPGNLIHSDHIPFGVEVTPV